MSASALLLFKLLHLLEPIEEIFKDLCIASDAIHLVLKLLALVVLHEEALPLDGVTDCEYLLLLGLGLSAKHLNLFLLDHIQDAFLDEANAVTGLLPQLSIFNHVVQLLIHF